jgi:actin-like ATPase involved in cell morphogenesis
MSQDNMNTHDQDRNWNATHKTGADDVGLKAAGASSEIALGKGLDIGTANLAAAVQEADGGVSVTLERNAFLDINSDVYSKNMLTKLKVPYIVHNNQLIVIGESAFELANVFGKETRRPMSDGLISPSEADALPMMKLIIQKVLGNPRAPGENCYFSVPAESLDVENNIVYHQGLFESMLNKLGYTGKAINEGHAVVFAELAECDFTGIGLSFGGGMANACICYKSIPCLSFSVARGGDWIDKNVANVLGIRRSKATMIKERGVDIRDPKNREEEAIAIYYRNLISYLLENIKHRFEGGQNMPTFTDPVDIACAGGTSKVGGFIEVFRDEFGKIDFPIPVGRIFRAEEALTSVARGCLVAAAIGE